MSEKILNCSLILSDVIELEGNLTKNIINCNGGQGNFDGSIKLTDSTERLVVNLINKSDFKTNLSLNIDVGPNCFLEIRDESNYDNGSDFKIESKLNKNSIFELFRLNKFNPESVNSFSHKIDLSGNCEFRDFNFSNGSQEMNSKTIISLKEQNASYIGSGAVISNSTNAKNELVINHLSKSAKSDCSFKTVSRGKSNITFSGMVFVDKDCSDTESNQISKGLVMDEEARINLIPMLDINNDDVVCAHGAASGKPDENILFYLKSRGISKEDAEKIYIEGFLGEFVDKISNEEMQKKAFNYITSIS